MNAPANTNALAAALINAGAVPSSTDNKAADKAAKAAKGKTQPGKPANDPEAAAKAAATTKALRVWGSSDGKAEASLLDVFRAVAHGGTTTPEAVAKAAPHISAGSCKAYSATFNKAAKAAAIVGLPNVLDLINKAAGMNGRKYERVAALLGDVMEHGKAAKPDTDKAKGEMVGAAVARMVEADTRKAAKLAEMRTARTTKGEAKPAAAPAAKPSIAEGAKAQRPTVLALIAEASDWTGPERGATADLRRRYLKGLQECAEMLASLSK